VPDIRIQRTHALGLDAAREIAERWIAEAEARFNLRCSCERGDLSDTVRFRGPGVNGTLHVAGDRFELHAALGFLLGGFARRIEEEIGRNLDTLLEGRAGAA
jgi:putative polyhydroxyalkanoate system protein